MSAIQPDLCSLSETQCRGGWQAFNDSCYYTETSDLATFEEAVLRCQSMGAELASIDSAEEEAAVTPAR